MSSRDEILRAVRGRKLPPVDAPNLAQSWITYADRRRQFAESLAFVGGKCVFLDSEAELPRVLNEHPAYAGAKQIVSLVPSVTGNVQLDAVDDPHQLADVDFAVMRAEFGVAENGAVWATDRGVRHRAVYFLCQHLVVVLDGTQLVDNMYQAYSRLRLGEPGFGMFLSGPSKTADIEQSLVIGAHGPRSMIVACIGGT